MEGEKKNRWCVGVRSLPGRSLVSVGMGFMLSDSLLCRYLG